MATTVRPSDEILVLDLPQRAYNALWRNNVREVGELANLTEAEFLLMRGVGQTSLEQTKGALARHGLAMRLTPLPPPDPAEVAEAEWIGRQLEALIEDNRVHARNRLGTRFDGEGADLINRRRAWAWYRWGIATDDEWPRDQDGGFGYMATPLPGGLELHLEGLNRLAREELDGE
jgi:hypothetical protein